VRDALVRTRAALGLATEPPPGRTCRSIGPA
jgi:hypothetical protein